LSFLPLSFDSIQSQIFSVQFHFYSPRAVALLFIDAISSASLPV